MGACRFLVRKRFVDLVFNLRSVSIREPVPVFAGHLYFEELCLFAVSHATRSRSETQGPEGNQGAQRPKEQAGNPILLLVAEQF